MTAKKQNSIISLSDYRKKKLKELKEKNLLDKKESSTKSNPQEMGQIFYMSNYLKRKNIPQIKELKKEQDKSFFPDSNKEIEPNNIIILDQYRKEKNKERVWKKEFPQEALSVAGMAFLFLFTFNLAVSLKSNSPSKAFEPSGSIARGENIIKQRETLKPKPSFSRTIASPKKYKQSLFSHKKWAQKINTLDREDIILGKKSSSSKYTGF